MFWEAVRFLFAFALVVALAWAAARLAGRLPRAGGRSGLQVEGALSLGGNRGVYLLRVAGRLLLVGVAQEVTLLAELSPDAVPEAAPREAPPPLRLPPWAEILARQPGSPSRSGWRGRLAELSELVRRVRGGEPD